MSRIIFVFFMILATCLGVNSQEQPIQLKISNGGYSDAMDSIIMGLEIGMPEGWHTYWKAPGEGGFPPALTFNKSENVRSLEIKWPTPHEIDFNGVRTIGYENNVVLPLIVTPIDPAKDVVLKLDAIVYACLNYCTSFEQSFETSIPAGYQSILRQQMISNWLRQVPKDELSDVTLTNLRQVEAGQFVVDYTVPDEQEANLFIATQGNAPFSVSNLVKSDNTGRQFEFSTDSKLLDKVTDFELVLSTANGSVSKVMAIPATQTPLNMSILLISFVGGLILNLMPCVFPVLSLKLLALTTGSEKQVRTSFVASSFGIVASFIFLGAVLSVMKVTGAQIGWGIQFQSPVFLGLMTLIVLLFALSTAGYFEIVLPSGLATRLSRATSGHSIPSAVGQGFVATLLATPCSAPFVGTAVGFALSGSVIDIMAVFVAMGLGMALPYLLIAIIPGIAKLTPRPGAWMNKVKLVFALALATTAGWLAVLAAVAAELNPLYVATPLVLVVVFLAETKAKRNHHFITTGFMLLAFIAPLTVNILGSSLSVESEIKWHNFQPDRIEELVQNGDTVFVYVTADWCLTCKVNERTALADPVVIKLLNEAHSMKADWTRPNSEISDFLKSNSRYGIPFSIIYSDSYPKGYVLSEILTVNDIFQVMMD